MQPCRPDACGGSSTVPGMQTPSRLMSQRRKPVWPCWVDSLLGEKAGARGSRAGRVAVRAGGRARGMLKAFEAGKAHLLGLGPL